MTRFKRLGAFALAAILATPALIPVRSFAVDNMASGDGVDLTSVRAKIKAKDFAAAKEELRNLVEDAQHPDVYSLLGFTLRKTGDYATSLAYYTKALELGRTAIQQAYRTLPDVFGAQSSGTSANPSPGRAVQSDDRFQ